MVVKLLVVRVVLMYVKMGVEEAAIMNVALVLVNAPKLVQLDVEMAVVQDVVKRVQVVVVNVIISVKMYVVDVVVHVKRIVKMLVKAAVGPLVLVNVKAVGVGVKENVKTDVEEVVRVFV